VKKAALVVMIMTIISKALGFGRETVLSYVYGASAITDAYLISKTIPYVIFSFISAGIATAFLPMYSRILKERGSSEANEFTSNLSNALLLLSSVIVVLVLQFSGPIVKLFASGFTGETLELATNFTRISIFGVFFSALLSIFAGLLRLHNNFVVPALVGFPMNFIIIASVFISTGTSIYVLAVGSLLATVSQVMLLMPFVHKCGYRHQPILNLNNEHLRKLVLIALPVIAGTSVNEINVLVDRTLASGIAVGGISALNYAQRLNGFVQGLFVSSITSVLYPTISRMAASGNMRGLKTSISEAISIVNLLVVPATVGIMIFSRQLVSLLFGRGAFTADAIEMTTNALFYYSPGMIAIGLRAVLSRGFYALQDPKTPTINATLGVIINIVLNIILSRYLGIGGLALATSVSATITALLMFVTLRKKIGSFGLGEFSRSSFKMVSCSALMGVCSWGSFVVLRRVVAENLALIVAVGVGALVYATMVYFMKIPEVDSTLDAVKKRFVSRQRWGH